MTKIIFIPAVAMLSLMLHGCAKIGSISGGPKDVTPPKVLSSTPKNGSINFDAKKINITFNEFIDLKDLNNQLIVSPPLKHTPDVRVIPKALQIQLSDTLRPKMTYTLNFGNSVVDFTENNVLKNYEYVFSTGDYIDSLSLRGTLVNAFDHKAGKDKDKVYIMLYDNLTDSAPLKEKPMYLAKPNDKGNFTISNLKPGKYNIFGLIDLNSDLKFDMPKETFAFSDTTIELESKNYFHKDTVPILDSVMISDSLKKNPKAKLKITPFKPQIELFSFVESPKKQYLTNYERKSQKKLTFIFNMPLRDSVTVKPLNFEGNEKWFVPEKSLDNDTLNLWMTDSAQYKNDTLRVIIDYMFTDSIGRLVPRQDTIRMSYSEKPAGKKPKKDEKKKKIENYLKILNNIQSGVNDLNMSIVLEAERPISKFDIDKIDLSLKKNDSTYISQDFQVNQDSLHIRNFSIKYKWQEEADYQLYIEPKAFTDIYNESNDTMIVNFKIQKEDFYGKIFLNVSNVKEKMIIQLLTEKEDVVKERFIDVDKKLEFDYIKPGKYLLKAIYDRNGNKKWDTGDYLEKIQPERTDYYPDKINVRANWELEQSWQLK